MDKTTKEQLLWKLHLASRALVDVARELYHSDNTKEWNKLVKAIDVVRHVTDSLERTV
ncbi:MAG: hypothetical protein ACJ8BW_00940 [Ktedonobacteraceae bacterium]